MVENFQEEVPQVCNLMGIINTWINKESLWSNKNVSAPC